MQTGQGTSGMQTMNQSLHSLLERRLITMEEAELRSADPLELRSMIEHGVGGRRPRA
jgi:twitching motility protein PilT